MAKNRRRGDSKPAGQEEAPPFETRALERSLSNFLETSIEAEDVQLRGTGEQSAPKSIGACKFGVYAFFDYDGEPIYVGQTRERLSTRIRRHLTGQRSDAVAKGVLDPYEVRKIRVWPMPEGQNVRKKEDKEAWECMTDCLDRLEGAVYRELRREAKHEVLLNEQLPKHITDPINITWKSYKGDVVNDEVFKLRSHVDSRIARRAMTLTKLSQNISERKVSSGLRHSLYAQARRLAAIAKERWDFFNRADKGKKRSESDE